MIKLLQVWCAGCKAERTVRESDWNKRKSDYCKGCSCRVRAGLKPSAAPSEKGTPLHNIWCGMRQRCGHKKGAHAHDAKHYAERGIQVCSEWRYEFVPFKEWALANGYEDGLVIDRKENDEGYTPSNCRWVTITESNRNKRSTLRMEQVEEIRKAVHAGESQRSQAHKYETSEATISLIMSGKIWR
jgi:hypothetical protein